MKILKHDKKAPNEFMETLKRASEEVAKWPRWQKGSDYFANKPRRPVPEDAKFLCKCGHHPVDHDDIACRPTCSCNGYEASDKPFEGDRWPVLAGDCLTCSGLGHTRQIRCVMCKKYVDLQPNERRDNNPHGYCCSKCDIF